MTSLKTSIKTITYLSDIGCLEIQGASLITARASVTERSGDQTEAQHALVKFAVSSVSQWATAELRASRSTGVSL